MSSTGRISPYNTTVPNPFGVTSLPLPTMFNQQQAQRQQSMNINTPYPMDVPSYLPTNLTIPTPVANLDLRNVMPSSLRNTQMNVGNLPTMNPIREIPQGLNLPENGLNFAGMDKLDTKNALNLGQDKAMSLAERWNKHGEMITGGINAAANLIGAYSALKTLSMQKDQLNFQKDAWSKGYALQRAGINDQLRQRQLYRNAERASSQNVEDYMKENGV